MTETTRKTGGSYSDLGSLSAVRLAETIRRGEILPSEAVDCYIRRIERVNPRLNAVVANRFEEAREEARLADERLQKGGKKGVRKNDDLPPFFGVPCTVKEAIALKGAPWTAGSLYRKGFVATEDAVAVDRVRKAGAIPLASTNISEMCMWFESDNLVYGRTNNPYDTGRIPGGSSGGEGSILGAGGAPFGVGGDVGGSIRMPAFFCGIFGHKPTGALVTPEGHAPAPQGDVRRYCTVGPLSRFAGDLSPLLEIMSGGDYRHDPSAGTEFRGRDVWVCEGLGFPVPKASDEQLEVLHKAADFFARRGARVRTFDPKRLGNAFFIWSAMLHEGGNPEFASVMTEGGDPDLFAESLRFATGSGRHTFPALFLAVIERVFDKVPGGGTKALVEAGRRVRAEFEAELGDTGILLMPTHPRAAPRHGAPLTRPLDFAFTGIFNVIEAPATAVPMGLGREGLPLGIQVAARPGNDRLTLAAALLLEEAFGGWVPPGDL